MPFAIVLVAAVASAGCQVTRRPAPVGVSFLQVSDVVRGTDRAALSPAAWSPDGRRFAYGARDGVWVHAPGDPAGKRIADGENVTAVAWSGPADVIAYVDRGALQTVRPDGAQRRKITIPGVVSRPVWAPAGDRLAVAVQPAGQNMGRLWWTSPDGATIRQIPWDPRSRWIGSLGWFADALYLFVGLARPDGDATVEWWRVRFTYPDFRQLTGPGRPALDPVLSPSGEWIAFVGADGEGERAHAVRPDGSGGQALSPSARRIVGLAWSRGGDKVAYGLMNGGQTEIYMVDVTGARRQRVTAVRLERPDPGAEFWMAWSPDESYLAYGVSSGTFAGPIWLVRFAAR